MKTHEEHVRRVKAAHGKTIKVVGHYTHSHVKVDYECSHGRFRAFPSNIEGGNGCRKCGADKRRLTHEQYVQRVKKIHGDRVEVVERFVDSHTKIMHACPSHGAWMASPVNVVYNESGCSLCYHESHVGRDRKSHATYVREAGALGVTVLDRYVTAHTPIGHKCRKGHIWETKPNQLLTGNCCPLCDTSQYRRRPVQVGHRRVFVQGAEGKAVDVLLSEEQVAPEDLAFTTAEGRPTFRYRFAGRSRTYVPDAYRISLNQVIEVKSAVTLGIFDKDIYAQVRAKARSAIDAGHAFRLMVIHRNRLLDMGSDWHELSWTRVVARFRRICRDRDRRLGRNRRSES